MNRKWLSKVWTVVNGRARMSRRKVTDVEKYASEAELLDGAKKRGFHVVRVGLQYVVFRDSIKIKC